MKLCSPTYVYSREIKLKVKVLNQDGETVQKGRLGVDRDTISLNRLRKHLIRIFKLDQNSSFMLTYQLHNASGEGVMAIMDDWDLEVALQQPILCLNLTIQIEREQVNTTTTEKRISESCDVLLIDDTVIDTVTKQPPSHNKFSSLFDKIVDKVEEFVFSNKEEEKDGPIPHTKPPMTLKEFQHFLDAEGRLVNYQAFRESVYLGGISHSLRKVAWRHLLCVFPEGLTGQERIDYLQRRSEEYAKLRNEWKVEYRNDPTSISEQMKFVTSMVRKDVIRTDRNHKYYKGKEDNKHTVALFDLLCTYALNHPDTSYCQGMCDLASPLLAVQDNEAHAYLLFCAIMQRMKHNFSFDGKCISTKFEHLTQLLKFFDPEFYNYMEENQVDDLLFSYRWLLLEMKREFPFSDSLYFTEIMWSSLPTVPSDKEIPFQQAETPSCSGSMPRRLSAFSKMNSLDCDNDSISTTYSSVFSVYPDCDALSIGDSYTERRNSFDQALLRQMEEEDESEVPASISSSVSPCQCSSPSDPESQSASVFYFDLEGNEVPSQCHCSKSVDSGFQSRPGSPAHPPSADRSPRLSQLFPPPKQFGYGNPFLLFAASAMILQQRDAIMTNKMDFNDIVMLFNSYKCQHNVHTVLKEAKQLYEAYISNDLEIDEDDYVHLEMSDVTDQHPATTIST